MTLVVCILAEGVYKRVHARNLMLAVDRSYDDGNCSARVVPCLLSPLR